ncbi:MAG TPA: OsmC family protein [Tepidiformaceae bacterium]|nr:OsmC family protein [Tepidiformaceae bacterium]
MPKVIVQSLADYVHAQLLTADGHALVADEPVDEGGAGLGPTPYDLLLWALGTCTAMTVQLYARRKGYPLAEVAVEIEHERIHEKDLEQSQSDVTGMIERLHRHIVVRGDLTDAQRDDLLRIAARCPVHKTIAAAPKVFDTIEVVG